MRACGAGGGSGASRRTASQIPAEISEDTDLKAACECLPEAYNFEVYKTIWRIKMANATVVALQFPEGLLMFATTLSDIVERSASAPAPAPAPVF